MSDLDRRTFVQGAVVGGAALTAFLAAATSANAADKEYFVIAEIVSKPEKADTLRDLMTPFAALSRKEPGCIQYALLEVEGEPGRFLTYEKWSKKDDLKAHMTTPHLKEIVPKLDGVLAKPFTQIFMYSVSGT